MVLRLHSSRIRMKEPTVALRNPLQEFLLSLASFISALCASSSSERVDKKTYQKSV